MTLNEKIKEYVDIVNIGKLNVQQQIASKMMQEEEEFTRGKVRKFIKRIQKETGVLLDETTLWNEVRDL